MKLQNRWSSFVRELALGEPTAYVQIRKMYRDVRLDIPWEEWDGIDVGFDCMGYSPGPAKMKQLIRNYFHEPTLVMARDKFISRFSKTQTCITARFGNQEKAEKSMGFCMQSITFNYFKRPEDGHPKFVLELNYRATEVIQKFLADLRFLDEVVFPLILEGIPIKPDVVVFKFSTLYVSTMYLPIIFQFLPVSKFLGEIKSHDPKWYSRSVKRSTRLLLEPECNYNFQTSQKMHKVFRDFVSPTLKRREVKRIQEILDDIR